VNTFFSGAILVLLVQAAMPAQAAGDYIRFAQGPTGAVSAVLLGAAEPCSGSVIFPIGESSVDLDGSEYDIATGFVILDPPGCPSPPQPYAVTASLGTVADGRYMVTWTVGPLVARAVFEVRAGILQIAATAVPTLSLLGLSTLFVIIALAGLTLLRRPQRG
jgi:hypothetical protein